MRYLAKMLLTAAVVMWSGLLVAGPATAFETDSVEKLGFELSTLKILGINQMWNLEETKRHFEEEGVSELDLRGQMAFGKYLESLLPEIAPVLSEDNIGFRALFPILDLPQLPRKCLFYQNLLEGYSEHVGAVGICFGHFYQKDPVTGAKSPSELHNMFVAVAMRRDRIEHRTMESFFRHKYGEPGEGKSDVWYIRPWYYAKMMTKNYIFLKDPSGFPRMDDFSSVAVYVNMNGLAAVYSAMIDELEKQEAAAK